LRLVWSDRALSDLLEIRERLTDFSINHSAILRAILRSAARLELFPLSGRVVPEYARSEVREVFSGRYRIIYRVDAETIEVLLVRDGRRPLPRSLP
jgi:plasmid stabilization system protein ParE